MQLPKRLYDIGRFLVMALRHKPETAGITLDANGWVDVEVLLTALAKKNTILTRSDLEWIVRENNKKRFAFSEDGKRIRASQGHSVAVDLQMLPIKPPAELYHGTKQEAVPSILEQGLLKGNRHQVHLSSDVKTAIQVGSRHGKVALLKIAAAEAHEKGIQFYRSENGVWLTDYVSPEYISVNVDNA